MKQKTCQVVFPFTPIVVMVAFLSIIIFANVTPSSAASSGKKKSSAVGMTSAVESTEARIKQLQDALKITDAQKDLWNNLTQVMRENAKEMDALTKDRAENTQTMNAVEQMKFRSQISEAHLNQLKKFIPPFEALYTSMSDQQKKNTDSLFRTGKAGKHRIQ
jgi:lipopolysaccharide export LptBFGC system permease protein LptF